MRELRKETETFYKYTSLVSCLLKIRNERTPKGDGNEKYFSSTSGISISFNKK